MDFALHPNVYSTGRHNGLRSMLEETWVRSHEPGDGTFYIVSGFANYNGGARFYRSFKEHTENGGRIVAVLGGSTSQHLCSKQVVEALLECGAEVHVISRKRLMHAKCYGVASGHGDRLIVSSGNFTGPAMAQNVEAAVLFNEDEAKAMNFSWSDAVEAMMSQNWAYYRPPAGNPTDPAWQLLYDETPGLVGINASDELTLVLVLGHADTARIQAGAGTTAARGTQYFWLSKDCFDFFPPLTIRNQRGYKGTLSTLINLKYVDLDETDGRCRVTFEAENNLDFRLGTGKLRNTRLAQDGDLACITRVRESDYELRIIRSGASDFDAIVPYATNFIGHRGKRYGYIENDEFERLIGSRVG